MLIAILVVVVVTFCVDLTGALKQEKIMSDIETLNSTVDQIAADEAAIKSDIATVITELQTAQANSGVDLTGAISKLASIHAALSADDVELKSAEPTTPGPSAPVA